VGSYNYASGETTSLGIGMQPFQTRPSLTFGQSGSSPLIGPADLSNSINLSTNFKTVQGSFSGGVGIPGMAKLGVSMSSGGSSQFSFGLGGSSTSESSSRAGSIETATNGASVIIPINALVSISLGYNKTRYWTDETNAQAVAGSFYANSVFFGQGAYDVYSLLDNPGTLNIVDYPDPTVLAGGTYPSVDDYTVLAQGLSGSMRPYCFQQALLVQNHYDANNNAVVTDNYIPGDYQYQPNGFRFVSDFSNSYRQAAIQTQAYGQYAPGTTGPELTTTVPPFTVPVYGNNDGNTGISLTGGRTVSDPVLEGSRHIDIDYTANPSNDLGYIPTGAGSQYKTGMFSGFSITNESGVTYHYDLPAYSYGEENYQQKISTLNGLYFNRGTKTAGYAYTWYLTSITGPDWVDRDGNGVPSAGDWGYWVNFEYGKWSNRYVWRNPSEGYTNDDDNNFQDCAQGYKEVYYLNAIRTRSHIAIFEKDLRQDGKGVTPETFYTVPKADQNGVVTGTTYVNAGGFNVNSSQSLQLSHIYLLNIADANFVTAGSNTNTSIYSPANRTVPCTDCELPQNVIDANDVNTAGRYALEAKAIRVIDFNYDYSLCPSTNNSFNIFNANPSPAAWEGKLTLNSVVTRGTGGTNLIPPTQFAYELTGPDPVSQSNVAFTNATAPYSPYFTTTNTNFHVGDMIQTNGSPGIYCGVITAITPVTGGQYAYSLAGGGFAGLPQGGTLNIHTTKNPPYNMNAYDAWGMYKADADPTLLMNNQNMGRNTSVASGASADAWSLRKIYSPLGDYMKINYQSNTYHTSVMNNTYSYVMQNIALVAGTNNQQITFTLATYGSTANPASLVTVGQYMSNMLLGINFYGQGNYCTGFVRQPVTSANFGGLTIKSISTTGGVTTITGQTDKPIPMSWDGGQAVYASIATGNLWINSTSDFQGGGVRVASISTIHSIDNTVSSVVYNYNNPAGVSSGVTSYSPNGLDAYDATALNSTSLGNFCELPDDINAYLAALYQNVNAVYPIARELPPPGVMYQYVTVTNQVQNPNESIVRTVPGSTQYQFEVLQPGMVFRDEMPALVWGGTNVARNWIIKKFTSGIGNIKAITQFDNNGLVLTQTINHYLHDNLEGQGATNDNFFAPYLALLQQPPYNYQGFVQERYVDVKTIAANYKSPTAPPGFGSGVYLGGTRAALSGREDYPCIQTGQTVINYVNGQQTSTTNLSWDYYSGAVTRSVETDAYGNNIVTETVPAYTAAGNSAMGLKINNDANKGMLTQVAETRKWKADAGNNDLELISAHADTWSDNNNVIDINGNAYVQNSATTNGDVWRKQSSYDWMSASQTLTADGLTPGTSFNEFNWATPASSDPGWKNTANVTLYDVYSNGLEGNDVNGNYSATHMDYGNQKVILTGSPANYYEIAYSGAEDANLSQTSTQFVSGGSGTIAAVPHTGAQSLLLQPAGVKGFSYSVPTSKLVPGRNYEASVWVRPTTGYFSTVGLYYDIDGTIQGSSSSGTAGAVKAGANGFYLLKLFINGSSIVAGHTLNVWVRNDHATIPAWVDDFRFQPQNASTTAYVYDPVTSQLDYVLDNSNVYTEYTYDAAGNLLKLIKEKLSYPQYIVKQWEYNYGTSQFKSAAINAPYTPVCQLPYEVGNPITVTVPLGMFNSFISLLDANNKAQAYAQAYANSNGTCSCDPVFTYSSYITGSNTNNFYISGSRGNFTWIFTWPAGQTDFQLGTIAGQCALPSATRTIPFLQNGTVYNLIISPTGAVTAEIMSGPTQGGTSVAFVSVYDLNLNAWYSAPETGTATHSCAPGQTGSTSTYTEPQYAFYSYLSQNDANSQAQTAANAAATTLAQNGTCTSSCNLVYTSSFSSYQATITTTGTGGTGTFTWAFSPTSSFSSGTLGTIPSSCCPSGTRNLTVNDQATPGRSWYVTITASGVVTLSLATGTAPTNAGPPVALSGTYPM
jgi:hypothetical protein